MAARNNIPQGEFGVRHSKTFGRKKGFVPSDNLFTHKERV